MEQKKRNVTHWHPVFFAGIQIELQDDADNLEFESEHQLSKKPMRVDVLIIKKEKDRPVKKNIGRIFRKHNILEYKSPDDHLSIDDFYKVYGYTCFYKTDVAYVNSIPLEELTITLVSSGFPRELARHLKNVRNYIVKSAGQGIYSVTGDIFPIQILVTSELSLEENLWLRSLTNKLDTPENAKLLMEDYMEHKENSLYRPVIETIMRTNQKLFEEVNGMSDIFMEIVQEKFDRKLKEETEKAVKREVEKALQREVEKALETEVEKALKKEVEKALERQMQLGHISLIQKKYAKNKPLSVIADELETEPDALRSVYDLIARNPEKTADEIYALAQTPAAS